MRILIVGAGPAGLGLAYSLKRASPICRVHVIEQRAEAKSAGLGITLPLDMAEEIGCADRDCFPLRRSCIRYRGDSYLEAAVGLIAIERDALLATLRRRCESAGVEICFGRRLESIDETLAGGFDLIVGADGVKSVVRLGRADCFGSSMHHASAYHTWLSTPKLSDRTLATIFQEYRDFLFTGWMYPFSTNRSAVILQASSSAFADSEVRDLTATSGLPSLAEIFDGVLGGNALLGSEQPQWARFTLLKNRTWHAGNFVLVGDAAHTAHFCRGFGTADALRDALSLSRHIGAYANLDLSLDAFERERMPEVALHQATALSASNWYERVVTRYENGDRAAVITSIQEAASSASSSCSTSCSVMPFRAGIQ